MWSDISSIARNLQEDAVFIVREMGQMQGLVTQFRDAAGMNPRIGYKYNSGTAKAIGDDDDLTSDAFTPSADQTLTPAEIGLQFFVTDARAESEAPENILRDAALELGYAALDKVETDLITDIASLTGGTIGSAGTTLTWGHVAAAISRARNANKSNQIPLACVLHVYQAALLAKSASVAGATTVAATGVADQVTRQGMTQAFTFYGVPIYQVFADPDSADDFKGGVFPRDAIAIDWRRAIRIRPERDESRRGVEFNMSAIYAHGIWRPKRGVYIYADATAPSA
jgi:hypothetical protein